METILFFQLLHQLEEDMVLLQIVALTMEVPVVMVVLVVAAHKEMLLRQVV
jgi:hypothetical protein